MGYRRLISVENFRTPNFELVAEIIYWLTLRYDPSIDISDDISTERARVEFLKSIVQVLLSKARVKLNIKMLYRADGFAVKELLKVASLLYESIRTQESEPEKSSDSVSLSSKLEELKSMRALSTEIIETGAKIYSLLGKEEENRKSREKSLTFLDSMSLNLENNDSHETIRKNILEQIQNLTDNVSNMENMIHSLEQDEKSLQNKIERKHGELERAEQRLRSLKKVRPAFMEEYEQLEQDLKAVYEIYMERHRNLSFLESELDMHYKNEREKKLQADRALKRMQKRLREEELRILRGEQGYDENDNGLDDSVYNSDKASEDEEEKDSSKRSNRPTSADVRKRKSAQGGHSKRSYQDDEEEQESENDEDRSNEDYSRGRASESRRSGRSSATNESKEEHDEDQEEEQDDYGSRKRNDEEEEEEEEQSEEEEDDGRQRRGGRRF